MATKAKKTTATKTKKPAAKKAVAKKKAPVKKTAVKKTSVKKTAPKKVAAKKAVVKKTPAKKTAPKKVAAKKAVVKKTTAKKAVVKKTPAKKTAPKKVATKKAVVKKTPAKKTATKKVAAKKAPAAKKTVTKSKNTDASKLLKAIAKEASKETAKKAVKKAVKEKAVKKPTVKKEAPVEKLEALIPNDNLPKIVAPPPPKKSEKIDFTAGDFVVYPAHGVGQVEGFDTQIIAGMEVSFYTICFEKDRMRLKIPVSKAKASGLRKLSSKDRLKDALATLQGRSQVRRIMWSRRAQEYETKINSGDPVSIAEVLRDLKKEDDQNEQSYSERQIYQAALARLAREVAAIEDIAEDKAIEKLEIVLSKVA